MAGRILQIIPDEEEAFWVFVQLLESTLPLNYYSGMVGVLVDSTILSGLVQLYLPDLYSFLVKYEFEMNLSNVIYRWLISVYVQNLSSKVIYKYFYFVAWSTYMGCFIYGRQHFSF